MNPKLSVPACRLAVAAALSLTVVNSAFALKYAAVEHHLKAEECHDFFTVVRKAAHADGGRKKKSK